MGNHAPLKSQRLDQVPWRSKHLLLSGHTRREPEVNVSKSGVARCYNRYEWSNNFCGTSKSAFCKPGYFGNSCNQRCSPPLYGFFCVQSCYGKCVNESCHFINGCPGKPVEDTIQLYILDVDSISENTMDYAMSFFLRQRWVDHRLAYKDKYNFSKVELDTRMMSDIWVPDLYISNEKRSSIHQVTVPNKLMHIYPDGLIVYSMRISGTFTCQMNLIKYPLDTQICSLRLESYGYISDILQFQWNNVPLQVAPDLTLPQFEFGKEISNHTCEVEYAGITYTFIGIDIELVRNYWFYIIQIYIPSLLIVILSWVSFWLNIEAIPARISLGLLTVLTMTTQSGSARANAPRVSYVKALDVWMATCLIFVFAALIEFAYVNVTSRVQQRRKNSIKELPFLLHNKEDTDGDVQAKEATLASRDKARLIDRISRIVFPSVFMVFNVIYWLVYSVWEPGHMEHDSC